MTYNIYMVCCLKQVYISRITNSYLSVFYSAACLYQGPMHFTTIQQQPIKHIINNNIAYASLHLIYHNTRKVQTCTLKPAKTMPVSKGCVEGLAEGGVNVMSSRNFQLRIACTRQWQSIAVVQAHMEMRGHYWFRHPELHEVSQCILPQKRHHININQKLIRNIIHES